MKKILYIFISIFTIFSLASCSKLLQEINTDPEKLGETDPRNVFTGATQNWNNSSRSHLMGKYSGVMQNMQYIVFYNGAQEGVYANPSKTTNPAPYVPYYIDYFGQSCVIGQRLRYLYETIIPNHPEADRFDDLSAISKMLEAYEAWLMFDVFGAAPYTEAFQVSVGIKTPIYDYYKDLYKKFDEIVKASVAQLHLSDASEYNLGKNDFFYEGDVAKWIKFGNTLRVKMAQRLEKADNAFYTSTLNDALADAGGIISNNSESCIYFHPNEYNNNTDDTHILTYQYCASRALVNFLETYDDPRLPLLVRRNGFGDGNLNTINDSYIDSLGKYFPNWKNDFAQWSGRYVGMAANPDSSDSQWSKSAYYTLTYEEKDSKGNVIKNDKGEPVKRSMQVRHNSQIESRFYVKNGGKVGTQITARDKEDASYDANQDNITLFTPQITYSETCFMMAEIAFKKGSAMGGKTAQQWYEDGIKASMEQYQTWGEKMAVPAAMASSSPNYHPITAASISAYMSQADIKNVTLEKIISQQWVNLYMRPEEAWATWKRTGLPAFKPQPTPAGGVAFFEELTTGETSDRLVIPRRCILPTPNDANKANYEAAIQTLTSDPAFGELQDTKGRIWWDK